MDLDEATEAKKHEATLAAYLKKTEDPGGNLGYVDSNQSATSSRRGFIVGQQHGDTHGQENL
eukprot:scaffold115907_cov38-Attheya_sp.AAC.2